MNLFEGGAEVNGSFIKEKSIQQMIIYLAPILIGGEDAPTSIGGEGFKELQNSLSLTFQSIEELIGKDLKIVAEPIT